MQVVECGAAINIENKAGLTPLTLAAYLARYLMAPPILTDYLANFLALLAACLAKHHSLLMPTRI